MERQEETGARPGRMRSPKVGGALGVFGWRAGLWTGFMGLFLMVGVYFAWRENREVALNQARDSFLMDKTYRLWITHIGERVLPSGEQSGLQPMEPILGNPTRLVPGSVLDLPEAVAMNRMGIAIGHRRHLTSLTPMRPEDAPDAWERQALASLGGPRTETYGQAPLDGRPFLRYMGAFKVEEGCLRCHAGKGLRIGDVLGGISVAVPIESFRTILTQPHQMAFEAVLLLLWLMGTGGLWFHHRWEQALLKANRATQDALRENEARYRAQFALASEGILTHSPEGELIEANEAFARMHGYSLAAMLRLRLGDLLPPGLVRSPTRMGRILAGEPQTFEVNHLHKDGHSFPVEVSAGLIVAGGRSLILAFHRDITERRQAEADKAELTAQLLQAQKMDSLGNLAGGVAHDMNNVLGAILALASTHLHKRDHDGPTHEAFSIIAQAADRGAKLVKSLLNFARKRPVEERELALNEILTEEIELLAHTTLARVRLVADLDPELHRVSGDPTALGNAFMNLCVNAVDAMPAQGTLTIRTRNRDLGWVEVQVEDTGSGMPPEVLEKALEPFFTTKEVGKGTGLGLSMVYSTVKAHGGQLSIQSQLGVGTCVTLQLPVSRSVAPDPVPAGTAPVRAIRPLTILLVDDDDLVRRSTCILMAALGHAVRMAASGEEALVLVAEGLVPDLVVLDLNMPGIGGAKTLIELRAVHPALPVLIATGRVDQTALDLVAAHPRVDLMPKPFTMDELKQHLERIEGTRP